MIPVMTVCRWEFFNAEDHWHSRSHYGPSWAYMVRQKAEEIMATGIDCQVIREDWGQRDYALSITKCAYPGCFETAKIQCSMIGCTHKVCETHGNGGIEEAGEQFFPLCWGCDGKGWGE